MVKEEEEAQVITLVEEEAQVITVVEEEEEAQVITMVEVITVVNKEDLLYLESPLKTS